MRPAVPCAALISAVIKKEYKSNKKLLEAQKVRSDATFLSEEGSATNRTALLFRRRKRRWRFVAARSSAGLTRAGQDQST